MRKRSILVVAAHPDDEVIGCGGTIARLVKEGYEAYTLILGEGITSRDKVRNVSKRKKEIKNLQDMAMKANSILGAKKVLFRDLPDNRFDGIEILKIIKVVEEVIKEINPEIIFTHFSNDLNIDHQITYKAVLTAARPLKPLNVKRIYSFEVLSSTEWNYPKTFIPNVFFDIADTVDIKIKALKEYKGEIKEFPHPRSLKAIKLNTQKRGVEVGLEYVEAFEAVRLIE